MSNPQFSGQTKGKLQSNSSIRDAVKIINDGKIHIVEPDLDLIVSKAVNDVMMCIIKKIFTDILMLQHLFLVYLLFSICLIEIKYCNIVLNFL